MTYLLRFYKSHSMIFPPFKQLMIRGSQRGDDNRPSLIYYFVFKQQLYISNLVVMLKLFYLFIFRCYIIRQQFIYLLKKKIISCSYFSSYERI